MAKRSDVAAAEVVQGPAGPTLNLQAVLDNDRRTRRAVWERFGDVVAAPWCDEVQRPLWAAELPEITAEMILEASRTYKKRTALGCDSLHPRWLSWLSQPVLRGLAQLLMALERAGVWPDQVRTILAALIPKGLRG